MLVWMCQAISGDFRRFQRFQKVLQEFSGTPGIAMLMEQLSDVGKRQRRFPTSLLLLSARTL